MDKELAKLFMREIMTISRAMMYIRDKQFKKFNLGKGQYAFITRIYNSPGITQEELSLQLKIDKTTVAKSIKRLENSGYVKKEEDINDRRQRLLYPSEKLSSIFDEFESMLYETTLNAVDGLGSNDLEKIIPFIEIVTENVNREWIKQKSDK